ncbi:MAG: Cna B-type domain-containing protein [Clostridia bacterium]|nr:Cna B-type domain-containing protein [Clostridia bacterium]
MKKTRFEGIAAILIALILVFTGCSKAGVAPEKETPSLVAQNVETQGGLLTGSLTGGQEGVGTYDPFYLTIPVTVTWDDQDDADGVRPDSVRVRLFRYMGDTFTGDDLVEIAEVRKDAGWKYEFRIDDPGDPVLLKSQGGQYRYAVIADEVDQYTESDHKNPAVKMEVTQDAWDVHGPDAEQMASVSSEEYPATFIAVKDAEGKYTIWTPEKLCPADQQVLAVFCAGHEGFEEGTFENTTFLTGFGTYDALGFTVTDTEIRFEDTSKLEMWAAGSYARSTSGDMESKITFHHDVTIPDLREAVIKITWDDDDNAKGTRPSEVKATLSNGAEVTLNESNEWTATVGDLPVYDGDTEIEYIWTENVPDGYELADTKTEGTVTTMTNKLTAAPEPEPVEYTEASVKIAWDDKENQDGLRPSEVKARLSNGTEVTLNEKNGWTAKVENLPKSNQGTQITYTWALKEEPKEYKLSATKTEGTVTTLTVSHTPGVTETTIKVVWDDGDNEDGIRPSDVKVKLSDGREVTLTRDNNWTMKVENLQKNKDGKEIKYTWELSKVPEAYKVSDTKTEGTVTTLTLSHKPATTEATIKVVWDDKENQDGIRPAEVKTKLSNGTEVTLNAQNSWTAKAEELPKLENGKEVAYTWADPTAPDGYKMTAKTEGTVTTVTFSHEPETTEAEIRILWDDNDNKDGTRPASITARLSDGTEVDLNEGNGWTAKATGLPRFASGTEILYSWTQSGLPESYKQISSKTDGTVTTLTEMLVSGAEPENEKTGGNKVPWIIGGSIAGAAVLAGLAFAAWKFLGKRSEAE